MPVLTGSELSAGIAVATLKLTRGGQVRICPQSQVNVSGGAQGLMLSMSAGAVEIDYRLNQPQTDLLATPDFNVRLAGPASYHFALGVNGHGDTCFKPLAGNTAGIVFTELIGDAMYGVAADEGAFFPEGKLTGRTGLQQHSCGCPAVAPPLNAAAADGESKSQPDEGGVAERVLVASREPAPDSSPSQPGQTHVAVETPFVFSGANASLPASVAKIEFSSLPNVFFVQEEIDPVVVSVSAPKPPTNNAAAEPPPTPTKEKKGFMTRVKGFFGSIFHH
jgi:hypothetical protein